MVITDAFVIMVIAVIILSSILLMLFFSLLCCNNIIIIIIFSWSLFLYFNLLSPLLLCRLMEVYEEGTDFYIVTELVQGGELFDRIVSKSHYTEKEARDLIRKLLETLHYMHENDVVHRDLKPENLLLTRGLML